MRSTILFLLMAITVTAMADVTKTGRGRLRSDMKQYERTSTTDTLDGAMIDSLTISGYDKPLRSHSETLFITNRTGKNLKSVILEITYLDSKGRQLHKATRTLKAEIPDGETRMLKFASWDAQCAFYFHLSPKPKRVEQATPYSVVIKPLSATSTTTEL